MDVTHHDCVNTCQTTLRNKRMCIQACRLKAGWKTRVLLTHPLDQSAFRSWSPMLHGHIARIYWCVTHLDLISDVHHLNLRVELRRPFHCVVLLVHHNISRSRHVVLMQVFDVQPNICTWVSLVHSLMMHPHSEHFPGVRIRNHVRWQENDFLASQTVLERMGILQHLPQPPWKPF